MVMMIAPQIATLHITLSQFLRDFIYIPLGGSRHGRLRQSASLFATMVLGGLWHGAGLTFIAWGAFHGVLLILNHAFRRIRTPRQFFGGSFVGWALTFGAFAVGMVFFRARDMSSAPHLLQAMTGLHTPTAPASIVLDWDRWGIGNNYLPEGIILEWFGSTWTAVGTLWTIAALFIAVRVTDTMEIVNYREGVETIPSMNPGLFTGHQRAAQPSSLA